MRRLSLSTKLFAAALPLVIAVGALLALTVRSDLDEVAHAERGADLGAVWTPLVASINAIEVELDSIPPRPDADTAGGIAEVDPEVAAQLTAARRATDQSLTALGDGVADARFGRGRRASTSPRPRPTCPAPAGQSTWRALAPGMSTDIDPVVAYNAGLRELVSIGQLLPAESGEAQLGRELLAVVKLAEARIAADAVAANVEAVRAGRSPTPSPLATAQVRYAEIESVMNEFSAIAPEEWAKQFRQSGFTTALSKYRFQLDAARRAAEAGTGAQFDLEGFRALSDQSLDLQKDITELDRRARPGPGRAHAEAGVHPHARRPRRGARCLPDRLAAHPLGDPPGQDGVEARQPGRHRATAGAGRGDPRPTRQGRAARRSSRSTRAAATSWPSSPSRSTRCRRRSSTSPTSRSRCCAAACRTSSSRWPAATAR